jgi:hypothetical protein
VVEGAPQSQDARKPIAKPEVDIIRRLIGALAYANQILQWSYLPISGTNVAHCGPIERRLGLQMGRSREERG